METFRHERSRLQKNRAGWFVAKIDRGRGGNALARARKTIRNMRWVEVMETRGHIQDSKIDHWQVAVKVGFTLDD